MPDNVLLNIFSQLDDQTVLIVPLVCKRWYYLSNTVELWLFKCKQLGKSEHLGKIEGILLDELMKDEDIDWKLAYFELKEFVQEIKTNYMGKINETFSEYFYILEEFKARFDYISKKIPNIDYSKQREETLETLPSRFTVSQRSIRMIFFTKRYKIFCI